MALPTSFVSITMADNTKKANGSPETSTISLPVITLNAGNLAAQQALHTALFNALEGITLGNPLKHETVLSRDILSAVASADPLAQRENKWLLRYHGATLNEKFQASMPTADLSQHMTNSEFVDLTAGNGLALKTAFEAVVRSPGDAAEAVILDSVQFVGRNT